jgi:hypothetical protein
MFRIGAGELPEPGGATFVTESWFYFECMEKQARANKISEVEGQRGAVV